VRSVLPALPAKESAHGYELRRCHPEERDNHIASLLVEGARLRLQADLEWLERCQEALT
jgi:ribosomal protein L29